MRDLEERLKELGDSLSRQAPLELRPTADALRRIRLGRAARSGGVLATAVALVIGGFAGARSLGSEEALPPTERDPSVSPFVDTWTSTDVDGRTRTLMIRPSDHQAYEITLQNHLAHVCSGSPSTLTGTGRIFGSRLTVLSPDITCDDGSEPAVEDDLPPPEELLSDLTFEHDPESDILINYSPLEARRSGRQGQAIYSGRTLVWGRAGAQSRVGDVGGWITYGDEQGIWARDVTNLHDPADRILLSPDPGRPLGWSPDGSKLLVVRSVRDPGIPPPCPPCGSGSSLNQTDLFVLSSDGTETRLTDPNEGVTGGGSFSPDGTAVVYAGYGAEGAESPSGIYVVGAEGGSPQLLLPSGSRRYPDPDKAGDHKRSHDGDDLFETALQEPKWSPDGSQIAYFEGMGDWGHSLRIMDREGAGSQVVVENSDTLGAGHVDGLEWSPDGTRLAFSIEGRLYVVGVDGSGFRFLTDDAVSPYWSPDGSHIAYTRPDLQSPGSGSLEIIGLDDLRSQSFGDGASGPWRADVQW